MYRETELRTVREIGRPHIRQGDSQSPAAGSQCRPYRATGSSTSAGHRAEGWPVAVNAREPGRVSRPQRAGLISPMQNIVYADTAGNHRNWSAPARVPIRRRGDVGACSGADLEYDWSFTLPFDELPRVYNPAGGIIVTPTHDWCQTTTATSSSRLRAEPYRQRRAHQLCARSSATRSTA